VRLAGWPVAVVAQDGAEDHVGLWEHIDRWDVLFLGGTLEWKLGEWGYEMAREATLRGKWVHVGKVNSGTRLRRFAGVADSADGTLLAYGSRANAGALASLVQVGREPLLLPDIWKITPEEDEDLARQFREWAAARCPT
jgi:hypothetical protein